MKISLAKTREKGFTLIEVLTVIIIIGILAAVAIPVFTSQRGRAQDSQTISDVKNIATFAETLLADRTKSVTDLSQSTLEYKSSANVLWDIKGNTSTGGYCISAFNRSGKAYNSTSSLLTYDSTGGGLKQSSSSCSGTNSTPVPTSSTGATAAPRNPAIANLTTNWGGQGAVAPDISAGAPKTPFAGNGVPSTYQIAYDGNFFYVASRDAGAVYKVSKTNGATWTTLSTGLSNINTLVYLNGWLYGTNQGTSTIYRINPSNGNATTVSGNPYSGDSTGLSTDGVNTLYNREFGSNRVRALTLSSDGTSIVSNSVVWSGLVNSSHAPLYNNGYLFAISSGSLLQKNIATGEVTTLATGLSTNPEYYWQLVGGVDTIYAADNGLGKIVKINLNTGALTDVATGFSNTLGLATDGTSLYVSQYYAPGGLTKVG